MKNLYTRKFYRIAVTTAILLATIAIIWLLYGVIAALGRFIAPSVAAHTFIIFVTLTLLATSVSWGFAEKIYNIPQYNIYDKDYQEREKQENRLHDYKFIATSIAVFSGIMVIVGTSIVVMWGGYYQGSVLNSFTKYTESPQNEYLWREPWIVAERSALSKTTQIEGNLMESNTTFLPYSNQYVTPVKARGFTSGLSAVVSQSFEDYATETCSFEKEVPTSKGVLNMNLNRVISLLDIRLQYNEKDIWAYCEGAKATLVVPVITMTGFPQGHPVPAGVVLFKGETVELRKDVASGELPGPVYPLSLAAAQRRALNTPPGFMDYLDSSGFATSDYTYIESNENNVTELLLYRKDGSGWDYVTPLTPNGKPFAITALATIAADHVTSGKLNQLTVHNLAGTREGNQVLADRLKVAFPQLPWSAGLRLVEVLPTSDKLWVGTLVSNQAVVHKVEVHEDGTACLQEVSGKEINCVLGYSSSSSDEEVLNKVENTPITVDFSKINELTNEELAKLAIEIANEQLRRAK